MKPDVAYNKLPYARSFTDLAVYQKCRALNRHVFKISKRFPKEEACSLTDQWRRASRSIGAQIAEAWAKRSYPKHFVSKLIDADGEQMESQHWTIVAYDDGYITKDEAHHLDSLAQQIGRMIGDMIHNADSFCNDQILRDGCATYFVDTPTLDELNTEYSPTKH